MFLSQNQQSSGSAELISPSVSETELENPETEMVLPQQVSQVYPTPPATPQTPQTHFRQAAQYEVNQTPWTHLQQGDEYDINFAEVTSLTMYMEMLERKVKNLCIDDVEERQKVDLLTRLALEELHIEHQYVSSWGMVLKRYATAKGLEGLQCLAVRSGAKYYSSCMKMIYLEYCFKTSDHEGGYVHS